jgi:KaiC/GvpD/RAD55 family RecA-like ATPase
MKSSPVKLKAVQEPSNAPAEWTTTTLIPRPAPFALRPICEITPRDFVCGPTYQRGQVTLTIAAPGSGKTSLSIAEALHMADGTPLLDSVGKPLKVWLFNGEEPMVELERRIVGMVVRHALDPVRIAANLFCNSGLDAPLAFGALSAAETDNDRLAELLVAAIRANDIDVVSIDPFVSTHREQENDNAAIDRISTLWARIAKQANCAVHLVHHTRKSGHEALTAESVRGASSLVATARLVRTLTPLSADQSAQFGRDDGIVKIEVVKSNNAKAGSIRHFAIEPYQLTNGPRGCPGDDIGVVSAIDANAELPKLVDPQHYLAIKAAFAAPLRADPQAADWAGRPLAAILGLRIQDRAAIKRRIAQLVEVGVLHRWTVKNQYGRNVPWIGLADGREKARSARLKPKPPT